MQSGYTKISDAIVDQEKLIRRLGTTGFCVLLKIAMHADVQTGKSWPSQKTIAHSLRVSQETVRKKIQLLQRTYFENAPILQKSKQRRNVYGGKSMFASNEYILSFAILRHFSRKHEDYSSPTREFSDAEKSVAEDKSQSKAIVERSVATFSDPIEAAYNNSQHDEQYKNNTHDDEDLIRNFLSLKGSEKSTGVELKLAIKTYGKTDCATILRVLNERSDIKQPANYLRKMLQTRPLPGIESYMSREQREQYEYEKSNIERKKLRAKQEARQREIEEQAITPKNYKSRGCNIMLNAIQKVNPNLAGDIESKVLGKEAPRTT